MNPFLALVAKGRRRPFRAYYHESYRLPLTGAESGPNALETRRADDAIHYLLRQHAVSAREVITPTPASYEALARVHQHDYLESLHQAAVLAKIFAVDASDINVDQLLRTLRLAVGGTLEASRYTLLTRRPALNLFGGFHHAAPSRGAGFCALNDVGVAIAELRHSGFAGRIGVIDFDFHPPDGTAACLSADSNVWIGSLSGADWGALPGVDENLLPPGTSDEAYLSAVEALLRRMPEIEFAFVLAGADVLAGDRLGSWSISLNGARQREHRVARALRGLPQVWLPAGGYSSHAWKVLAGVGLTLAFDMAPPIPPDSDPLAERMKGIARTLRRESLSSDAALLSEDDVAEALHQTRRGPHTFLGYYTEEGLEYALERYRLLPLLRRLGFEGLRVSFDQVSPYERARLWGRDASIGAEQVLVELEVAKKTIAGEDFLFVNWLSLRNPRAKFTRARPKLPGQEVPGLGLAKEMHQLLGLMAKRLHLQGVAFRPSWFHMAFAARHEARFVDPRRQGRFEALMRDTRQWPLVEVTHLVADGHIFLNGEPYQWEADDMIQRLDSPGRKSDEDVVAAERNRCHFSVRPPPTPELAAYSNER